MTDENIETEETVEEVDSEEAVEQVESPSELRLTVNGQERVLSLEEAKNLLQKELAADEKFQRASALQKEADSKLEEYANRIKSSPEAVLEELGISPEEWAEKYLTSKYEESLLDPAERERRQKLKEYEQLKAQEEERRKQEEQTQYQEQVKAHAQKWDEELDKAFDELRAPKTPGQIKLAIDLAILALDNNQPITAKQAVEMATKATSTDWQNYGKTLEGQALLDFLGDDITKKIQKALAGRVTNTYKKSAVASTKATKEISTQKNQVKSVEDVINRIRGF